MVWSVVVFSYKRESVCSVRYNRPFVRIDGPRGGELWLFQIYKTIKATLIYAMLVRHNSPTGLTKQTTQATKDTTRNETK